MFIESLKMNEQEYIRVLIQQDIRFSFEDFFKVLHAIFCPIQDISLNHHEDGASHAQYFLELTNHDGKFYVKSGLKRRRLQATEKLIEYRTTSSKHSDNLKKQLDDLGLVENEEYSLHMSVCEQKDKSRIKRGAPVKTVQNIYRLTPNAFKKYLMRIQTLYQSPKNDNTNTCCNYFLMLEKIYRLYIDYEKQFEQYQQELTHKTLELENGFGLEEYYETRMSLEEFFKSDYL